MTSKPLVSVVVPTYNGLGRLPQLLHCLGGQTLSAEQFEIIVVDDGSSDGSAAWAGRQPGVRVIRSPGNVGQGAATNLGVRAATAPIVAMTDDDTSPLDTWLERGLAWFEDKNVAFLGGQIALDLGEEPGPTAMLDYGMGYLNQEQYVASGFAATANFWARRDMFMSLGAFDEDFVSQCHDVEFGQRLRRAGLELIFAPDVVVAHPPRADPRAFARKQFRLGFTASELRHAGVQEFTVGRPLWARTHYYRPWLGIWGLSRIRALGLRPRWHQLLRMWCLQYLALQLPLALGNARGAWIVARR